LFCFTYSEYEYKQEHDLDHGANPGERWPDFWPCLGFRSRV
jgi:hypothetical protein